MIELAFGESSGGALKLAKTMKHAESMFGPVCVTGGAEKERLDAMKPRKWPGMPMEGGPEDVEALTLALDIGDISDMDTGMIARKKVLDDLFADFPGVSDGIWNTDQHALMRVREAKSTMEPIRMWVCTGDPVEMCGMYFIRHLMADAQTPLSVVRVPQQIEKGDSIVFYRSTGEIAADELGAFARHEEPIGKMLRGAYSAIWNDLALENAPLRAIVNGIVVGVPDDFYDFSLRANMPDGEFRVVLLIGKTLNRLPGVSDRWLFLRTQAMINSGELIEVSAAAGEYPYSGIIKRNK
jgi:hypothetical protein